MARTPVLHEEKKAQIIQAALATFSKYGYEGTTNKLIAQEAGKLMGQEGKPISPALIYHYFPEGKSQLFAACLQQFPPIQKFKQVIYENQEQPPEVFLQALAHTYNSLLKTEGVLPIIRIVVGESNREPELVKTLFEQLGPAFVGPMLGYFQRQIQAGKTSVTKPDQIGIQLFAPLFMRRILLNTIPAEANQFLTSDDDEFINSLVQNILRGVFHE